MESLISASVGEVSRLCASGFYDFIIVGTGMGGGILARTIIERAENAPELDNGGHDIRVLLIERGGMLLTTHCANTSSPRWNSTSLEGPSMNTDIVFRLLKTPVSTVSSKSYDYVGGPVYCIGGRSTVWGMYTPYLPEDQLMSFPKSVRDYLNEKEKDQERGKRRYNEAYQLLCNDPLAILPDPYPISINDAHVTVEPVIAKLNKGFDSLHDSRGFKVGIFGCCPMGAEFAPRNAIESLYRVPMGGFSTVGWILDRVYNKTENLTVLAQTQVLTVNRCEKPDGNERRKVVSSLTVRDHLGHDHKIPTGNATVILSAGSIDTARIALRSGIGGDKAGRGLTDHDIWGTRFEYMPGNLVGGLQSQALRVQSWVTLNPQDSSGKATCTHCLLNITINAQSFLGNTREHPFPTTYFNRNGEYMTTQEYHKELKAIPYDSSNKRPTTIQIVFEFESELCDRNRVLNLPEQNETVLIHHRDDNSAYLPRMRAIARRIKKVLENRKGDERNYSGSETKVETKVEKKVDENDSSDQETEEECVPGLCSSSSNFSQSKSKCQCHHFPTLARAGFGAVAHEVGTMRMGDKQDNSVVDDNLKVRGWTNLHVCDLSVFPVSPAANPSLTLTALSQRLGNHLYDEIVRNLSDN
ncbi:FAD/NAD(P)-binding domain-containing protein [Trichoderma ceciliae]